MIPLVNVYITMERSTVLLMGQLTILTGPFSIATLNYHRAKLFVCLFVCWLVGWLVGRSVGWLVGFVD